MGSSTQHKQSSNNLKMAPTPQEVNQKFLDIIFKRSGGGILGLARNFKIIDKDGSGQLSEAEFNLCMTKFRIGLTKEEVKILFRFYDKDNSGSLAFDEFLKGLRGKMSEQRRELTEQAFVKMDTDGSGELDINDLKGVYDCSHHPKVISGEWSEDQALSEFIKMFEGDEGDGNSVVTLEEWMDYHAGLSANIDEDDAFGIMMAQNWGIEFIPKKNLELIMETIRTKCAQKGGGNPKQVAKQTFKFFDSNNSGSIDYKEFGKAMESFAPNLNEKELTTFFGMFDGDNSGEIEYKELIDMVFDGKR